MKIIRALSIVLASAVLLLALSHLLSSITTPTPAPSAPKAPASSLDEARALGELERKVAEANEIESKKNEIVQAFQRAQEKAADEAVMKEIREWEEEQRLERLREERIVLRVNAGEDVETGMEQEQEDGSVRVEVHH